MILRRWRGAVRPGDLATYLRHQADTGVRQYRETPGNRGVLVLRRPVGDLVEVVTLSLWTSMDDVRRFAGDQPDVAKFYPGDSDLLTEKDTFATHHEVVGIGIDPDLSFGAP